MRTIVNLTLFAQIALILCMPMACTTLESKKELQPKPIRFKDQIRIDKPRLLDIQEAVPSHTLDPRSYIFEPAETSPYFGPLFTGSDLDQIKLVISGSDAKLYMNQFFEGHPGESYYALYYQYGNVPTNDPTPSVEFVPGAYGSNGSHGLVSSLERINWSSRYGGSVELFFLLDENYEMEFRSGSKLWDIGHMHTRVYVKPSAMILNHPALAKNHKLNVFQIEFEPKDVTAYKLDIPFGTSDQNMVPNPDPDLDALNIALQELAASVESSDDLNISLSQFVHGMIQEKFKDDFSATGADLVDSIEITDGFINLHTHVAQWYVAFAVQIEDVEINTEFGEEEILVKMESRTLREGLREYESIVMDNHDSTGFVVMMFIPLSQCSEIEKVILYLDFYEQDKLYWEASNSVRMDFFFNWADIQAEATGTNNKIISQTTSGRLTASCYNSTRKFKYTLKTRTILMRQ